MHYKISVERLRLVLVAKSVPGEKVRYKLVTFQRNGVKESMPSLGGVKFVDKENRALDAFEAITRP